MGKGDGMRQIAIGLLIAAGVLGAFGYWGISTVSGRQRFDEMAGMIPMAAAALAVLMALGAAILLLVNYWKSS